MHREPEAETRDRVRPDAIVVWPDDHEHDIWDLRGEVRLLGFGIVIPLKGRGSPLFIGKGTMGCEIIELPFRLQHTQMGTSVISEYLVRIFYRDFLTLRDPSPYVDPDPPSCGGARPTPAPDTLQGAPLL